MPTTSISRCGFSATWRLKQPGLFKMRSPVYAGHLFMSRSAGWAYFDNPRQAVLYAHIDGTRKLNALCGDVTDVLTPLGFDFGIRPFIPHITLARLNDKRGIGEYIERHDKFAHGQWRAESFSLMRSGGRDSRGRKYTALAQYPLLF
jgi:RNA 2',3'-cyclic 3'-phosphodiesterase